jgi:hypothetical protein
MAGTLDLSGWTPVRVRWADAAPVEWVFTGDACFTEPFFEETITRALRDPFALLFRRRTSIETLLEWGAASPGLRPRGLVFHMSRCGSTLVTQMLARSPRFLVLSEPAPVDGVLRAPAEVADRVEALRAVVSALAQPRQGETELVLKLDSWSVLDLDVVEQAFPATPWVFLYRRPEEVLASQLRHAGVHGIPGALPPESLGLEPSLLTTISREEYLARVLARICEAALAHAGSPNGLFVEYPRLPGFVLDGLPAHFGFELSAEERALMAAASQRDAKNPVLPFEPGAPPALSPEAAAASRRFLEPLYESLLTC